MLGFKIWGSTVNLGEFHFFGKEQENGSYTGINAYDFLNSLMFLDQICYKADEQNIITLIFDDSDEYLPITLGTNQFLDSERNPSILAGFKKLLRKKSFADLVLAQLEDMQKRFVRGEKNTLKSFFENKKILMFDYSNESETLGRRLTDMEYFNYLTRIIPLLKEFDGEAVTRFGQTAIMSCPNDLFERGFPQYSFYRVFGTDPEFMDHLFVFDSVNNFYWNIKEKVISLNAPDYFAMSQHTLIKKAKANAGKIYDFLPLNKIPFGKGTKIVFD